MTTNGSQFPFYEVECRLLILTSYSGGFQSDHSIINLELALGFLKHKLYVNCRYNS